MKPAKHSTLEKDLNSDEKLDTALFPPAPGSHVGIILGWIFSTLVAILSTKTIIDKNESPFPLTLTAFQMTFCTAGLCFFLPRSLSPVTSGPAVDATRIPLYVMVATSVICYNCAYVDFPVSVIEMLKLRTGPLIAQLILSSSRMRLDIVTVIRCLLILFGSAVVCYSNSNPSNALLFGAVVFDAVAAVSTINLVELETFDNLLVSTPSLQFIPICAVLSGILAIIVEGPLGISQFLSAGKSVLLLINATATFVMYITGPYLTRLADLHQSILLTIIKDILVVVLSSFLWGRVGYVQTSGYCVMLLGIYLLKDGTSTFTSAFRTRKVLIFLVIAATLFYSTFTYDIVRTPNLPPLSRFLYRNGLRNDSTIFVTMASKEYLDAIVNFRTALDKFGIGKTYLVLCLDTECVEGAKANDVIAYGGYRMNSKEKDGDFHVPVARAKLEANIDLIDGGYNFIMLDADVYLTGTRHPLSGMRPLADPSWEIQFQCDWWDASQDANVNIGWYWARPTNAVRELFVRSAEIWNKTKNWDQAIMNDVRSEMVKEGSLTFPKSIVLGHEDYVNAMLVDWRDFYFDQSRVADWNNKHVMVHYTGIFNVLKTVIAKHFGQWFVEDYYTQSPRLLQPINISGTTNQVIEQIALSVHLAKTSGRTFMWPLGVNHTCSLENPQWWHATTTAVVEARLVEAQISWVEDTYLFNRKRYTEKDLELTTIPFADGSQTLEQAWYSLIEKCQTTVASVVQVDFFQVNTDRLRELPPIRELIEQMGLTTCQCVWLPDGGCWFPHGCVNC